MQTLLVQELKKMETKRTLLIPEIRKIEAKQTKGEKTKMIFLWIEAKKNEYIRTSTIEGTKKNEFFRT